MNYIQTNKFKILLSLTSHPLLLALFIFLSCNYLFAQWTLQGSLMGLGSYPRISVYSPTGIVVAGGLSSTPSAKVYISTNSGLNWTDITGDLPPNRLYSLWAVNENLIFVGDGGTPGVGAKLWKTTNGGTSWTLILTTGGSGFFNDIVFSKTNPLIGIAQSDPPIPYGVHFLAKTTDGGNTWNTQNTISTNGDGVMCTGVCIDNLFYGWGVYPPARVVFTTDGGVTWNQRNIGGSYYTSGLAFSSDKNTGLAMSADFMPNIGRSTDGGNTWTTINTYLPMSNLEWGRVEWVYGTNTVYLAVETGASGCIGKSTNAGQNWSVMSTNSITNLFDLDLTYVGGMVYAYAITRNGSVIKLQESIVSVQEKNKIPFEYSLEQNYPNPFNPGTTIKFDIVKSGFVTLKIYDILGKEIEMIVNENLIAGSYKVSWDAGLYPSGVYFYKLTTNEFSEVKKMSLVK